MGWGQKPPPSKSRPTCPPPPQNPIKYHPGRLSHTDDISRQAKILSLSARMHAVNARVAGMEAQAIGHFFKDFYDAETELKEIAVKLLEV